ncbi:MAG: efflux RND transporter periplasmic adaptor subunit [Acidobacteria bacterium]|nr:MAG: efflux RND transporter periplasmic adaptor subunit [Acidobacteriota bacterium]PYT61931.1 MAG: efflux RND transporter periplasmic adaptor subunit [Acidobacteriota bacterium]
MTQARIPLILILCTTPSFCASCGTNSGSSTSAQGMASPTPTVAVAKVTSKKLSITTRLPGELQAYEVVAVFPKVTAYVDSISVDRGSRVKAGQLMARLVAPEVAAQRAEAQSKLQAAEAQRAEAEAKLASDQSTYERLKSASATPGVVAGNDLEIAQKSAEGDRARLQALRESAEAAKSALKSVTEIEGYLQVRAPFDGIVTERNVHPGSLVGPPTSGSGAAMPMLRVEKTARLRLVVPVPEKYATGINVGSKVEFSVPAFPSQTFAGTIARVAHSVDVKTRTMPVELDVNNSDGRLSSGMFPEVLWPVRRTEPTLFVPTSAVARTTEATFVIRIRGGNTEWVNVQTGELDGKSIEVYGGLHEGDEVAVLGTDELRAGSHVVTKQVTEAATGK